MVVLRTSNPSPITLTRRVRQEQRRRSCTLHTLCHARNAFQRWRVGEDYTPSVDSVPLSPLFPPVGKSELYSHGMLKP